MTTKYDRTILPQGPIVVEWLDSLDMPRKKGGWVVRMPGCPGFTFFSSPSGRDTRNGLSCFRMAVRHALWMAEYHHRVVSVKATEDFTRATFGREWRTLQGIECTQNGLRDEAEAVAIS